MFRRPSLDAIRMRFDNVARRPVTRAFHRLYYTHGDETWRNTSWFGTPAAKCPLDLWVYQELLFELRPDLVVETGTASGGSALFLATCMDIVGTGRVITIDIRAYAGRPEHPRITYMTGSSPDEEVVSRVRDEAIGVDRVLVVLDSDHSCAHVRAELAAYAPLVTRDSYVIVEDTNVNGHPVYGGHGPGPNEAVDDFLRSGAPFVRDTSCEKFLLTFNPGGYLRRVA